MPDEVAAAYHGSRLTFGREYLIPVPFDPRLITEIAPAVEEKGVQFEQTVWATGLDHPWGLAFLPDGSALVSERDTGLVKRVPAAGGAPVPVGRVKGARPNGEGGLLGIALPPGPDPRFLFAYYTGASDNRVVRIAWDGTRLGRQTPILTGIPRNSYHDGGRLLVGPDETLFVGTGDAATAGRVNFTKSAIVRLRGQDLLATTRDIREAVVVLPPKNS